MSAEGPGPAVVHVVDDDGAIRDALAWLLGTRGLASRTWASAEAFLAGHDPAAPGCLVLDIRMEGMSGIELFDALRAVGSTLPVIFLTGHGDVPLAVEAMRGGAVDFLQKPFDNQALLERVRQAIERGRDLRVEAQQRDAAAARLARLSPREREVLELLVLGRMNKAIAAELGISAKTVEDHRASVMRKMQVRSVAELVRLVADGRPRTAQ